MEAELPLSHPAPADRRWPGIWLACFVALAALLALANVVTDSNSDTAFGWDASVNCAAVDAHIAGRDPYFVGNLQGQLQGQKLSYPYLPVTLDAFRPLCAGGVLVRHYMGIYLALAALCCLLLLRIDSNRLSLRDGCLRVVFALGAFLGFEWTFLTGNLTILTGLLTAVALLLLLRPGQPGQEGRESLLPQLTGAALLGLLTSFKLVFCPILAALYFLPLPRDRKLILIATGAGVFVLPILISMVFYADLFPSWLKLVSGQLPDQHSPVTEGMNPSLFFLAQAFLARVGLGDVKPIVFGAYVLAAIVLVVAPFAVTVLQMVRGRPSPGRHAPLKALDLWLLDHALDARRITVLAMYALYLCAPRLKGYSFFELAIYASLLIVDLPPVSVAAILGIAIVIPSLSSLVGVPFADSFSQLIVALVSFWILLSEFRKQPGTTGAGSPSAAR